MNEAELRRIRLLQEHRKGNPAVHPRYQATYHSIYENEEKNQKEKGTFFLRCILSILLFVLIAVMDSKGEKIGKVDSQMVIEAVSQDVVIGK